MNKNLKFKILFFTLLIIIISIFTIFTIANESYVSLDSNYIISEVAPLNVFQAGPKMIGFTENFDKDSLIEENWPIKRSGDNNWWVSSGAYLYVRDGVGETIQGNLNMSDKWVNKFNLANAKDTANGYRPQNIFRLVYKKKASDYTQSVYSRINYYDESESENRNASNGILLFNRYQDEFSLYYAGVRVDGNLVIKKKLNGVYYTLALKQIFEGDYDRFNNPNLIPIDTWIGIKTVVQTVEKNKVKISLYTDIGRTGIWTLALEVLDSGELFDKVITKPGYGGIRTDFMDASFDDFEFKLM